MTPPRLPGNIAYILTRSHSMTMVEATGPATQSTEKNSPPDDNANANDNTDLKPSTVTPSAAMTPVKAKAKAKAKTASSTSPTSAAPTADPTRPSKSARRRAKLKARKQKKAKKKAKKAAAEQDLTNTPKKSTVPLLTPPPTPPSVSPPKKHQDTKHENTNESDNGNDGWDEDKTVASQPSQEVPDAQAEPTSWPSLSNLTYRLYGLGGPPLDGKALAWLIGSDDGSEPDPTTLALSLSLRTDGHPDALILAANQRLLILRMARRRGEIPDAAKEVFAQSLADGTLESLLLNDKVRRVAFRAAAVVGTWSLYRVYVVLRDVCAVSDAGLVHFHPSVRPPTGSPDLRRHRTALHPLGLGQRLA